MNIFWKIKHNAYYELLKMGIYPMRFILPFSSLIEVYVWNVELQEEMWI